MKFKHGRLPEANIQAELYSECKKNGIRCYLEYKSSRNGIKGCKFDAVITVGDEIIAIIEVKSVSPHNRESRAASWRQGKQYLKYKQFGLPIIRVSGFSEIPGAIEQIKTLIDAQKKGDYGANRGYSERQPTIEELQASVDRLKG